MLDIKEYLKQTRTVLVTQDAFDELVKKASAQPEIQQDGTLNITIDTDISQIRRVLVSQSGTQYGNMYYADAEPQWIPRTSTKRPKDREEVMVTIDDGYHRYTDTDEYVNGQYWYHNDKQVVAWKPFDEPWRGER